MKRFLLPVLIAAAVGCSDEVVGPPPVAKVNIFRGVTQPADTTLEVGTTVRLHADLQDASGSSLFDRPVRWRSTAPIVAEVDSMGLVSARAPGSTLVVAEVDAAADTLRVVVAMPPDAFVACATTDPGLALAVGQVHTVQASQATLVCLRGGENGSEYTVVPFHASTAAGELSVEIAANGVTAASGPPNPSRGAEWSLSPAPPGGSAAVPDAAARFHRRLREWERANLASVRAQRPGPGTARRSIAAAGAALLAVGDTLHLNASSASDCRNPDVRVARVEAVTDRAIVVADTLNPADGFTRAEFEQIGRDFDDVVWPVDTENFGDPSDIDANGKVVIFFTKAVNDLTEPNAGSYVAGFFWGRDHRSKDSCEGSNGAEIFYMLVPDPGRGEPAFMKENVVRGTLGVVAHEFQHLINFSRRGDGEAVWLNEGLSHIAEELVFYRQTGLGAERNLGIGDLRASDARRDAANRYVVANHRRYVDHLREPWASSAIADDDELATRGAAWAFLRYVADRAEDPAGQPALWRRLAGSVRSGLSNVSDAVGADAMQWLHDWSVAVYSDDAVPAVEPRFVQPSWNFRDVLSNLLEGDYPLGTLPLRAGEENDTELRLKAGGAAYLRFGVAPGQRAALRTTSGGAIPPSTLRLSIVRTR